MSKPRVQLMHVHVLLVEDDEDDSTLTRDLLADIRGTRFQLDWARSYREGLRMLQQNPYDVVLLDYRLGEGTGLDFLDGSRWRTTTPDNGRTQVKKRIAGSGIGQRAWESALPRGRLEADPDGPGEGVSEYLPREHLKFRREKRRSPVGTGVSAACNYVFQRLISGGPRADDEATRRQQARSGPSLTELLARECRLPRA